MHIKRWIIVTLIIFLILSITTNGWLFYTFKKKQENTDWAMSYVKDRTMALNLKQLVHFVDNYKGEWKEMNFRRELNDLMNKANNGIAIAYNMTAMNNGKLAIKAESNLHEMLIIFDQYRIAGYHLYKENEQKNVEIIKELIVRLKKAGWGINNKVPPYNEYKYSQFFDKQVDTFLKFNSNYLR